MGWKYFQKDNKVLTLEHKMIRRWEAPPGPAYPTDGLMARYDFEDNLLDSYGSFNATAIGSISYDTGKIGKCLVINGTNEGADTGINCLTYFGGRKTYSFVAWIFMGAASNQSSYLNIIGNDYNGVAWQTYNSTYAFNYYRAQGAGPIRPPIAYIFDSNWHMVVAGYDGNNTFMDIDNGKYKYTASNTQNITANTTIKIFNISAPATKTYKMDNAYIYNRALSEEEIAQLWNDGSGI